MTARLNKKRFYSYVVIYFLIALMSIIIWASQFSSLTHYKGDEFFFFAGYLLVVTIGFYSVQIFIIRLFRCIALLNPFATVITSIILGLCVLTMTSMVGTPTQIIYVYGLVYSVTNILLSIYFFRHLTISRKTRLREH
jgi:hypothetical protein